MIRCVVRLLLTLNPATVFSKLTRLAGSVGTLWNASPVVVNIFPQRNDKKVFAGLACTEASAATKHQITLPK